MYISNLIYGIDFNDMSASQVEYLITKVFGYPFTRRRLINLANNGVLDTNTNGASVKYRHSFNILDIHWILVFILTTEVIAGTKQGVSIDRKFNIFGMAKEIVEYYWRNDIEHNEYKSREDSPKKHKTKFENYSRDEYTEHDFQSLVNRGLDVKSDMPLLHQVADCFFVFDALLSGKESNDIHRDWDRVVTNHYVNNNVKPEISLGTLWNPAVIEDAHKALALIESLISNDEIDKDKHLLYVWLDAIRLLDNSTQWLSKCGLYAFERCKAISSVNEFKSKQVFLAANMLAIAEIT